MKILIAGASGFIGSELTSFLKKQGHKITALSRNPKENDIAWNPGEGKLNPLDVEGFDAFINLAGENIAGLWTASKKKKILESRVQSAKLLKDTISKLHYPPKVFINSSAIGYYGSHGDKPLTEDSPAGEGFLADVTKQWEAAAAGSPVRTVLTRFGVVLDPKGGALAKMLIPFKLGLGGPIGSGKQYMSWVALKDVIGAINFALNNDSISGPLNVVAPHAITNYDFTKELGKALHRPTVFKVPEFVVKTIFGEMGDAMLLSSQNVVPAKLQKNNYKFAIECLEAIF